MVKSFTQLFIFYFTVVTYLRITIVLNVRCIYLSNGSKDPIKYTKGNLAVLQIEHHVVNKINLNKLLIANKRNKI